MLWVLAAGLLVPPVGGHRDMVNSAPIPYSSGHRGRANVLFSGGYTMALLVQSTTTWLVYSSCFCCWYSPRRLPAQAPLLRARWRER